MADHQTPVAPRGDEAELFRSYNHHLMHDVESSVFTTSPTVVEDACSRIRLGHPIGRCREAK
jgi:hypothetical protein